MFLFSKHVGVILEDGSDGLSANKTYIDSLNFRENMAIENPVRDGCIYNWDIFENRFSQDMNSLEVDLREFPVLFTEKPFNPPNCRQRYYDYASPVTLFCSF